MQPTASSAPARAQVDGHRAGGVREVPDQRRAALARRGRQRRHVGERARAVADVREHDDVALARPARSSGDGPVELVAVEDPQLEAARGRDPLEHVAVGREVAAVGDERAAAARVERGAHELVEVDGHRVRDDHLAGRGAEQRARARRRRAAAGRSSRASRRRAASPHSSTARPAALARGDRQPPERVAVEVDAARRRRSKRVAEARERVGGVERLGVRARRSRQPFQHRRPQRVAPGRCGRSGPPPAARHSSTASPAAARRRQTSAHHAAAQSSRQPSSSSTGTPSGTSSLRRGDAAA